MPDESGKTYTLKVTLTVYSHTDEHLRDEYAIRDGVGSWLASLDAEVLVVEVRPAKEER